MVLMLVSTNALLTILNNDKLVCLGLLIYLFMWIHQSHCEYNLTVMKML